MSGLKKLTLTISSLFLIAILWNWQLISYGLVQLKGQLHVLMNTRPVDQVLADPLFPDSLKSNLRLSKIARSFAVKELGLDENENYTTVFDQKGQTILWNLSACKPYALEPYMWHFPFLGSMPYKGFFDLEDAKIEREELIKLGYDTRIRTVGGWSTLGILKDPILSKMLERGEGQMAEVIIHELTHATLFIKNEINFNENLASFIGEKGAELFLINHFGDTSQQFKTYRAQLSDERKFTHHILRGTKILDSLYQTFSDNDPIRVKDSLKISAIRRIVNQFDTLEFEQNDYSSIFKNTLPNNAYFMGFVRYHSQEDTLQHIYESYDSHIPTMINGLKSLYGK